ncbi:CaiB/BaiF CoA transferase family protein [Rhodococcus rhodochrous]|uniref:CaiB/BaiF CoA transferase family protein n=1 Tax=Rhodococcus rhodochrous TaxID=1829 RepID=UPI00188D3282|nr:CaiB/BaiF CoA-transferase family protein [Rhodococcus rhodochrous]MBF4476673.1 CoA transferase [Rhodococcus rhodochrous]
MTGLPLSGVTVVAMEQAVAVPFATRQLADLGARVIKIERPESGDFARGYDDKVRGLSSAFVWLNRGKESIELDIKSSAGKRALAALLERADVFLHNISPSAARRQGVDSQTLAAAYPNLICGSVSGYGSTGPLAEVKAYDLLIQGETGLMSLNGDEENFAKVGISVADIAAGMYTFSGVLAAIHHRSRTGEALPVDVSLFDSLTEWLSYPMYYTQYGGVPPRRMGTSHATIAPYGGFTTADGQRVLLAVQNDREWKRFCRDVLERSELSDNPRFNSHSSRVDHREELDSIVAERISKLDLATVEKRLESAEVAFARMNTIDQLHHHEQLRGRGRWVTTDSEVGPLNTLLPPWFPPGALPEFGRIPTLGEHTDEVLAWLGLSDASKRDESTLSPAPAAAPTK